MAKKVASKSLDSGTPIDGTALPQEGVGTAEETVAAPKKRATRKKSTSAADPDAKPVVKRTRKRAKIDGADPSIPAPVMKAFWGVFNPMMVQVAQYDYAEESEAQKVAADLTEKKKAPHFVQIIKKVV